MNTELSNNISVILFNFNKFHRSQLDGMTDTEKLELAEDNPYHSTIYDTLDEFQADFNIEAVDEVNNWLFFIKRENNDSISIKKELAFQKIQKDYHENDICMSEILAATPADGLSLEEAFHLYVKARGWADNDTFLVESEGVQSIIQTD